MYQIKRYLTFHITTLLFSDIVWLFQYKNINMFKATVPPSAILDWSRLNSVKIHAKVKDNTIATRWEIFEQFLFTFV